MLYRCPWCGWEFDPYRHSNGTGISCFEMMPRHILEVKNASVMSSAALESGADAEFQFCKGSYQRPVRCEKTRG